MVSQELNLKILSEKNLIFIEDIAKGIACAEVVREREIYTKERLLIFLFFIIILFWLYAWLTKILVLYLKINQTWALLSDWIQNSPVRQAFRLNFSRHTLNILALSGRTS